ncbi:hypothetical protein BPC006_II0853 [Burkholderia pseudomallei BPC006]|nr:hypothetical protein BPC006_II0853 [Burkholderia pseudomallei BPC006]
MYEACMRNGRLPRCSSVLQCGLHASKVGRFGAA